MTIDESHFTPGLSLAGGLMLGVAVAAFILVNGRILGISGIVGGLLGPRAGDMAWRLAFLLGMLAAPATFLLVAPAGFLPAPRIDASDGAVIAAASAWRSQACTASRSRHCMPSSRTTRAVPRCSRRTCPLRSSP